MAHLKSVRQLLTIAASVLLVNAVTPQLPESSGSVRLTIDQEAFARSSGGRSGGGSFRSSPSRSSGSSRSSSPSRSNSSSPSRSNSSPSYDRSYDRAPGNNSIIVVPGGGSVYSDPYRSNTSSGYSSSSQADWLFWVIFLGIFGVVTFSIVYFLIRAIQVSRKGSGYTARDRELENNTVTVSKIQVALLAQAREIQAELTELSQNVDTEASEGLMELLQESALALLRTPENWSHVLASSQTVKSREDAESLFNKISVAERSKFSVETLTNVGGRVKRRELKLDHNEGPASYIVVTLLVGTAHDKPLFNQIRTTEELTEILEKLASLSSDYLMVFELLWSPQDARDSLTYDELLTEYTEMVQI